MPTLSQAHISEIKRWLDPLDRFMQTAEGRDFFSDRENRNKTYSDSLQQNVLEHLTEEELGKLIGGLWANEMWADKSQPLKRILKNRNLQQFKQDLKGLLWGNADLAQRYDNFRNNVKGMGSAMITEVLCLMDPEKYGIWNRRARTALDVLKLNDLIVTDEYGFTGERYQKLVAMLQEVGGVLKSANLKIPLRNLLDVDYFLHFVATHQVQTKPIIPVPDPAGGDYDFDHDEVRDALNDLGLGLGFESETEVTMAKGARVDVLWTSKIGNLGVVKYAFEVQRGGSIDSLIMNLQKARGSDSSVQRVIAVANTNTLEKIRGEASSLMSEFTKSMSYMEAKEALRASDNMKQTKEILDKLQLVKSA